MATWVDNGNVGEDPDASPGVPTRSRKIWSRPIRTQERACGAHNTKIRLVAFAILLFALSVLLSYIEEMRSHRYREDKLILAPALCAEKQDLFDPASRMCRMRNSLAFASLAMQPWARCDMSSAGADILKGNMDEGGSFWYSYHDRKAVAAFYASCDPACASSSLDQYRRDLDLCLVSDAAALQYLQKCFRGSSGDDGEADHEEHGGRDGGVRGDGPPDDRCLSFGGEGAKCDAPPRSIRRVLAEGESGGGGVAGGESGATSWSFAPAEAPASAGSAARNESSFLGWLGLPGGVEYFGVGGRSSGEEGGGGADAEAKGGPGGSSGGREFGYRPAWDQEVEAWLASCRLLCATGDELSHWDVHTCKVRRPSALAALTGAGQSPCSGDMPLQLHEDEGAWHYNTRDRDRVQAFYETCADAPAAAPAAAHAPSDTDPST